MNEELNEEYITVPLGKLETGWNPPMNQAVSWRTYTESWRQVDNGERDVTKLPLYYALMMHYSRLSDERLRYEATLLGLKEPEINKITQQWIRRHIELYRDIKTNGYQPEKRSTPISVSIDNNGAIRVNDGHHTVSILRHLELKEELRVKVNKRDGGWKTLKKQLHDMYDAKLLYQPVNHSDFQSWNVDRACTRRWCEIYPYLGDMRYRKALDIGCNMGYFTERLTDIGAVATGLDTNQTRIQASRVFSKYHGYPEYNPQYKCTGFEAHLKKYSYDLCLMLSLFHHYLRENRDNAWKQLYRLSKKCTNLVLELGTNRLDDWHPEYVLEHTAYIKYTVIRDEERPIYLYE